MRLSERQVIANHVVHFYINIANRNMVRTVRHFVSEGENGRIKYNTFSRYQPSKSYTLRSHSGQKSRFVTPRLPFEEFWNVSKPFITKRIVGSEECMEEWIVKKLIPFMESYQSNDREVFWPDITRYNIQNQLLSVWPIMALIA